MPELPEVEVVRRGLDRWVVGRTIRRARVHDPRSVRRHVDGPHDLELSLAGANVMAAARRGKFLWLPLQTAEPVDPHAAPHGVALVAHLGMSGQLLVEEPEAAQEKHLKVCLDLSRRQDAPGQLRFVDQRIFGGLWLSPLEPTADGKPAGAGTDAALLPADAAHIARDVLDPALNVEAFVKAIRSRRTAIKALILDQHVLAGVGNIYADEALYRSRLHYLAPGASLSRARVLGLLEDLRDVMTAALAAGGTSFDSLYVNVNGASGYFDRSLDAYGREGERCHRCEQAGRPGRMVREPWGGRSSYRCSWCQRAPRRASTG